MLFKKIGNFNAYFEHGCVFEFKVEIFDRFYVLGKGGKEQQLWDLT